MKDSNTRIWLFVSLFIWIAVSLATLYYHEMWRDELQAIMIAFRSDSVSGLLYNSRYEGHGFLWFYLCFLLSKISTSLIAFKLMHWLIAFGSVVLLFFRSPFSVAQKLLFGFGYFLFYEYTVITRNYSLSCLLAFLFCFVMTSQIRRKEFYAAAILFLLFQTTIYGFLLGAGLSLFLFRLTQERNRASAIGIFLFLVIGGMLTLVKMMPPVDSGFAEEWTMSFDLQKAVHSFEIIFESFVPVPNFYLHFWGTNILDGSPILTGLKVLLSLALLTGIYLFFKRSVTRQAFFLIAAGIVLFTYIKYEGFLRHYGHLVIGFIACLWLDTERKEVNRKGNGLLFVLCSLHVVTALFAILTDLRSPFSGSQEVAKYLSKVTDQNSVISADPDFTGIPVAGYLNRDLFLPRSKLTSGYIHFDTIRENAITFPEVYSRTLMSSSSRDIYFLLNYIPDTLRYNLTLLYSGPPAIVEDERYFVLKPRK